jgi:L-lactate utilization protein LutC
MIDPEVLRLRGLRDTALRARAIATVLQTSLANLHGSARRTTMLCASAAACWRIARAVTGRLRAHPYLRYQRGPSQWRAAYHRFSANVLAALARFQGRSLQTLSQELRRVVHELDDARALTWSAELSDSFGRSQLQLRQLIQEIDAGARRESSSHQESATRDEVLVDARPNEGGSAAANWPYLAI